MSVFNSCEHPRLVFNKYLNKHILVSCGKCVVCRGLQNARWCQRLEMESSHHRYTLFGTLTYPESCVPTVDLNNYVSFSPTFEKSVKQSQDFVSLRKGIIQVFDYADFSNFMKRLRTYIFRHYGIKANLRFFCAPEYGPTTFRPHFHYLLWFDDPRLFKVIKDCIFHSWLTEGHRAQSLSQFLKYNRHEFVRGNAASYVAGYLHCTADLPPVLFEPEFVPKHHCSLQPSIGEFGLSDVQVQRLSSGDIGELSYKRTNDNRLQFVSVWRSLESRLFPRCVGFSLLPARDRISLYKCPYEVADSCSQFAEWVYSRRNAMAGFAWLFWQVYLYVREEPLSLEDKTFVSFCRRVYYLSRRVHLFCISRKIDFSDFEKFVDAYYVRKDYNCLKQQLVSEVEFVQQNAPLVGLSYLPAMIDPCFLCNGRGLSLIRYDIILSSFSLQTSNCFTFNYDRNLYYCSRLAHYRRTFFVNRKKHRKKDFIANHPEYSSIYRTNLIYGFI